MFVTRRSLFGAVVAALMPLPAKPTGMVYGGVTYVDSIPEPLRSQMLGDALRQSGVPKGLACSAKE